MSISSVNHKLVVVGLCKHATCSQLLLHVLDEYNPDPELLHLLSPLCVVLLRVYNETEDDYIISTHLLILMYPKDAKDIIIFLLNQMREEKCIA